MHGEVVRTLFVFFFEVAHQGYGIILMASFKLQLFKQFYEPLNVDNADGCLISSLPSPPVTSLRDFGAKK